MYNPDLSYQSHLLHLDDIRNSVQHSRIETAPSHRPHPLMNVLLSTLGRLLTHLNPSPGQPAAADHMHRARGDRSMPSEESLALVPLSHSPTQQDDRPAMPEIVVRRAWPADLPLIADLLASLSERTRYLRYFLPTPGSPAWSHAEAARMTLRSEASAATFVAVSGRPSAPVAIGVAELVWGSSESWCGELGLVVRDDQQGRGVGRALGRRLLVEALMREMRELSADLLPENRAALQLIKSCGIPHTLAYRDGLLRVTLHLSACFNEPAVFNPKVYRCCTPPM